ncbi:hypothetical protein NU08_3870 [Flavobacterium anhuiense]|uniref:Uncharacterized protein n=1 Tax=Flavobacterium anhuiense TaxID=459526 RepID=A0A444VUW3_9FLAO|nr:hypothetical protein NU08_3870 [Flavobacterium anhuiense]
MICFWVNGFTQIFQILADLFDFYAREICLNLPKSFLNLRETKLLH